MKPNRSTRRNVGAAWILASALAGIGAAGCGQPDSNEDDVIETTTAALTPANLRWYYDYAAPDIDPVAISNRVAGFRPISISAYGTPSAPAIAAVFAQRTGPDWQLKHGVGLSTFQATFNMQAGLGYKVAMFSFDGAASNPVWAAVFVQSSNGIPFTRTALVLGDAGNDGTLDFWLKKARVENLIPTTLSIYGTAASPVYALVVEPNTAGVEWSVGALDPTGAASLINNHDGANDTGAQHQLRANAQFPAGNRPSLIDINGDDHYIAMYRDDSIGPLATRHDMTSAGLAAEITNLGTASLYPIAIHAGGSGAGTRYAAFFAQTDQPQPRAFLATGSGSSGDTAITSVDNVVRDFMQRNNVRQASLAVVNNRKLAYARGYSYAEAGYRSTTPTTSFRLASVSKPVTAIEIMRLVDRNLISLDDKVQSVLNLTTHTGAAPPALFSTITIRHLLTHQYPTLAAADGSARCLRRDALVDQAVATAFGASLPVTVTQSVRYSLGQSDLFRVAGGDGCYSNFAYALLSMVIASKRNTTFAAALQTDLFNPLGVTRFHIAGNDTPSSPLTEALYRPAGLWTAPSVMAPGTPLVSSPYGAFNLNVIAGAGGMSMAPTDLARVFAMLNLTSSNNPVFIDTTTTDGDPATIPQMLTNNPVIGFDMDINPTGGHRYVKGGYLDGLQSTVSYAPNGITYVLFWSRNWVFPLPNSGDNWWPTWTNLESALAAANLASRADLFPSFGMTSFPVSP